MELHAWVRSQPFFLRMTIFTRLLLAAGFIPTGMVKLLGERFTLMPPETPVGAFFEAMYQTGLFWRFIGAAQVLAGLLLLFPRLAHLGAAMFLPVMSSIFVITVGLGFRGTPWVTGLMLLAVLYLVAWDGHRFWGLLYDRPLPERYRPPRLELDPVEKIGFALFGVSLIAFFGLTRFPLVRQMAPVLMLVGTGAGLVTLIRFLTTGRRLRPAPETGT